MKVNKSLMIGLGALSILVVAVGLAFASDASPTEEPVASPYFEATLRQAVDELDGKVLPSARQGVNAPQPTTHYTTDEVLWPECQFGYTRDPIQWQWCHYTSDANLWPECDEGWPTKDYTWDSVLWPECDPTGGPNITQDPASFWCNPTWTHDPAWGPQCVDPNYTLDTAMWPWCNPRYTTDPALWPTHCFNQPPAYTEAPDIWPECGAEPTSDPYLWPECHYTSDPQNIDCMTPYPTQDYTSNPETWYICFSDPGYTFYPQYWPWCNPEYTTDPLTWPECAGAMYTQEPAIWSWCNPNPNYTTNALAWPECHYTSDPATWPACQDQYPTKDYTQDANIWPECDNPDYTQNTFLWPWCDAFEYTWVPDLWPWCAPNWTWEPAQWPECEPGYTNDPGIWPECEGDPYTHYTQDPQVWPECDYYTADARIWPECHFTSDVTNPDCDGIPPWPTKDYTTDIALWPECDVPPGYTADPNEWPECHYTSDPAIWPECEPQVDLADLGDAPDSSNHSAGANMTAYPAGGPPGVLASYPTVFDPLTGPVQGPKHWFPRADAWLGPWVTLENDADLMPDEDGVTNIAPLPDTPDRDGADDGLLYPVNLPDCSLTVISYTVTVTPGAPARPRYVNVWFDWNRDGDWQDVYTCTSGLMASEWAVQDHVITVGPGTHVLQTPWILPYNPTPGDPLWMRISLAERPAPTIPGTNMADGRGPADGYYHGETEDYYIQSEPEPDYDIYLKDNDTDDGSVPSSVPWWNSPDIWVRNDGDCTNTAHENPTPGSSTTVCVRVRNRLTTTVDNITVNMYWANAALALSWPGSWSYIGNVYIPSLAGGATTTQSLAWNVPFFSGHLCLLARADAPAKDPLGSGPDTVSPVDKTKNNNNIAQRNTNVVDYPEITECGFYTTTVYTDIVLFDAVNTWNKNVAVDIQFDSSDFPLSAGTLIVDPGTLWMRWTTLTGFNQGANTLTPTSLPATMGGIQMTPGETARMTLTIAAEIDYDFTIKVTEYVSGTEVGGIDYVRDLPRCIYLPIILKDS